MTAFKTVLPKSSIRVWANPPFFAFPTGVRAIDTITASLTRFTSFLKLIT